METQMIIQFSNFLIAATALYYMGRFAITEAVSQFAKKHGV